MISHKTITWISDKQDPLIPDANSMLQQGFFLVDYKCAVYPIRKIIHKIKYKYIPT